MFYQNQGPIGPIATMPGWYQQPANPWVHKRAITQAIQSQQQQSSRQLIGSCCQSCADHAKGHGR